MNQVNEAEQIPEQSYYDEEEEGEEGYGEEERLDQVDEIAEKRANPRLQPQMIASNVDSEFLRATDQFQSTDPE